MNAQTTTTAERRRAEIVVRNLEGKSVGRIARQLEVSRPTVYAWLERFGRDGLDGLREKSRRTQAPSVSETKQRAASMAQSDPGRWTVRTLAEAAQVSRHTAWLALRAARLGSPRAATICKSSPQTEPGIPDVVRLREIARTLELHPSTVSRALSGRAGVRASTRERVQHCARQLDYQPDPALQRLAEIRWNKRPRHAALAYLGGKDSPGGYFFPHFRDVILQQARMQADVMGYHLDTFAWQPGQSPEALVRIWRARGLAGVIIGYEPVFFGSEELWHMTLGKAHLPFISLAPASSRSCVRVFWDFGQQAQVAWQHIEALMPMRVGLADPGRAHQRLGYLQHMIRQANMKQDIPPLDRPLDRGAFTAWVRRHRPKLVMGGDFHYLWLKEMGRSVPDEVAFVSLEKMDPENTDVAGVYVRMAEIGRQAVKQLDLEIRFQEEARLDPQRNMMHSVLACWIHGSSFPPPA